MAFCDKFLYSLMLKLTKIQEKFSLFLFIYYFDFSFFIHLLHEYFQDKFCVANHLYILLLHIIIFIGGIYIYIYIYINIDAHTERLFVY